MVAIKQVVIKNSALARHEGTNRDQIDERQEIQTPDNTNKYQ